MRRSVAWLLLGAGLVVAGCKTSPPVVSPSPSADLMRLDTDTKTPMAVLVPQLVAVALTGTPWQTIIKSSAMPQADGSVDVLIRLPVSTANHVDAQKELVSVLSPMLIPMSHHKVHKYMCQLLAQSHSGDEVAVEMDQLKASQVDLSGFKLGDSVPPERIQPHLEVVMDQWQRITATGQGSETAHQAPVPVLTPTKK